MVCAENKATASCGTRNGCLIMCSDDCLSASANNHFLASRIASHDIYAGWHTDVGCGLGNQSAGECVDGHRLFGLDDDCALCAEHVEVGFVGRWLVNCANHILENQVPACNAEG